MFTVYILFSEKLNRFYIGQTQDIDTRIFQHNSGFFADSYTSIASDWKLKLTINCISRMEALKIETFIKKMKSRKFIESIISDNQKLNQILSKLRD
jgi:putative endonuclease